MDALADGHAAQHGLDPALFNFNFNPIWIQRTPPAEVGSSSPSTPPPPRDTSISWFMSSLFCCSSVLALHSTAADSG